MSTLSVTTINTPNTTTDSTITTGNSNSGKIVTKSDGTGIVFYSNSTTIAMTVNTSSVAYNTNLSFNTITFTNTLSSNSLITVGNSIANAVITPTSITVSNATSNATVNTSGWYDSLDNLRSIPINNQTVIYTLAASDNGKTVATNSNITVNGALLSANQIFTIFNNSAASITITAGANATIYLGGTATTGNRTLAQRGIATLICYAANSFVISGVGLT